jgi:hypothetical protein
VEVDACVCEVIVCAEDWFRAGVVLVMKGPGDGIEADPLIAGAAASLELPVGCGPNRRRAAFKVASRVPADPRGESSVVESEDSDSVKEPEAVSEAEEVESEVDVLVDCSRTGAGVSCSAGRGGGWARGCCSGNCIPHGYQRPSGP